MRFFFFSSRRRHTRWNCDWSSDVCSSDLSGLLSGEMTRDRVNNFPEDDWRKHNPEFQEPRLYRNLWLAELLKNIGRHHSLSAGEIAIAWTLRLAAVTGAIVG